MKKNLLSVLVIIIAALAVLCIVFSQNKGSDGDNQMTDNESNNEGITADEQRNEEGILIISIDTNPTFFEKAIDGKIEESTTYTTQSEELLTLDAGIKLTISPEKMEEEQIYESYILVVPDEVDGEAVVYCSVKSDDYVKEIQLPAGCQRFNITDCSQVQKVTCPEEILSTNISNCSELADIVFPEECYMPDVDTSFMSIPSLTQIIFPASVEYIGNSFMGGMESLAGIELNKGLQVISYSFWGCDALERIDIPSSVTTIREGSFSACDALKEVTLHDGLETISDSFKNCPALEILDIPDSVTLIDGESFTGCDNLTLIVGHDTAAEEYAIENDIPYQYRDEWS